MFALNPTVIIVGYGGNEAFDGAAGLPKFVDGLNILLDTLAPTKARIVLLAPLRRKTSAGRCPTRRRTIKTFFSTPTPCATRPRSAA